MTNKEEKQTKKFKKSVILKSKDPFVQEHLIPFKVVLDDKTEYTLEEAKQAVSKWLNSTPKELNAKKVGGK